MKERKPNLGLSKICRLFGVTRQAYYQYFERNIDTELEHELIITEVLKIRRQNPRIGTRKLYVMLECFMHEHQIKMGRDALFNPNSAIEKKEYFSILISNCVAVEKNKR